MNHRRFVLLTYEQCDDDAVDAAMTIMNRAFAASFGEAWTASQLSGMLDFPGSWLTLAQVDQKIVGFALWRAIFDEAELLLLAVDPDWQGQSIGAALVDHGSDVARSRSVKVLHLEVRSTNSAVKLYRKIGFVQINVRAGYYRGRDGQIFDALTFRKDL